MPREQGFRPKGQRPTKPQEHYRMGPSRKVHARPTDPYAKPQRVQSDSDSLLQFRDSMLNLTGAFGQHIDERNKRAKERGRTAAMRGEAQPEAATNAFMEGYESWTTVEDIAKYSNDMADLYARAKDMAPEEWAQEAEQLNVRYLGGRSDSSIKAFVPEAFRIQERYRVKVEEDNRNYIKSKLLQSVDQSVNLIIEDVSDPDSEIEDMGAAMNVRLTEMKRQAKEFGAPLSREEIDMAFIKAAGRIARQTGNTEVLDFAAKPDATGLILASHPKFAERITADLQVAKNTRVSLENARISKNKAAIKQYTEAVEREIVKAIAEGDPNSIINAKTMIDKYEGLLSSEKLRQYHNDLDILTDNGGWSDTITDMFEYSKVRTRAAGGELAPRHYHVMRGAMDKQTAVQLINLNSKSKNVTKSPAGAYKKSRIDNLQKRMMARLRGPVSAEGNWKDPQAGIRMEEAEFEFTEGMLDLIEEYESMEKIPMKEIRGLAREVHDTLIKRYKPAFQADGSPADEKDTQAVKSRQKHPSGALMALDRMIEKEGENE